MSIAGPADQSAAPAAQGPSVNRRTVLGAALAAGAGAAALRTVVYPRLEELVRGGSAAGRGDWISPLGGEKAHEARIAHLLRRTAFGATLDDLELAASDGYARTVDRLLETRPAPPPPLPGAGDVNMARRLGATALQQWWIDHMLATPTPFAERMTLLWHGHFTSDYRKVGLNVPFMHWQNLTWRDMALTDLRSILLRVTVDPAMLRYLDLATSTGQAPNENYARELLELFALGVDRFSEDDVRAAARALAGWIEPRPSRTVPAAGGGRPVPVFDEPATAVFVPNRAYRGGPLTFLGRRDTYDAPRIVDRILAQPAAAVFIAGKVVQHFVTVNPDEGYVRRLADRFRASRYDVKTLMRAVLTSPEFTSDASYRTLVKSPVELMVHALRAVRAPHLARLVVQASAGMGQVLFDPPDVGGWPTNDAWISSSSVVARVNFVSAVLGQLRSLPPGVDAPRHVDTVLGPATAALLNRADDDRARWFLTLVSPEFQLK